MITQVKTFRCSVDGLAKTGKDEICGHVAARLGLELASAGGFFRAVAKLRGLKDYQELERIAVSDFMVDYQVDSHMKQFALSHERCLIQGRRVRCVLQEARISAVSVLLTCRDDIRFVRAAKAENISFSDAKARTLERERLADRRYQDLYQVSFAQMFDPNNFTYVIDTSDQTAEESQAKLLECLSKHF